MSEGKTRPLTGLGDAVREEIVVRFIDVREDSRATDKSSVALYIE